MDELGVLRETARSLIWRSSPMTRVRALSGEHDADLWRRMAEAGWLSMALPAAADGAGAGLVEVAVVAEELGRTLAGSAFLGSVLAARVLASAGDAQAKTLARISSGETVAALSLAETETGWDSSGVQTEVAADGTLTGRKFLVPDAGTAEFFLVSGRARKGPALYLAHAGASGVTVRPAASLDLTRRFSEVTFDGTPASEVSGADVASLQDEGAALVCAETVGAASRLLEMTVAYASERKQFGRAIGSFQAVKHRCADMLVALEASRAATDAAIRALDAGSTDAAREVSAAKAYVDDACAKLAADSLQVHGGIGFTWELDVHLYLRRIRSNRALFGAPSWHRDRIYRIAAT